MWTDPIRGQDLPLRILTSAMERGKLAQSYLLYGPDGVGKRLTALRLAMAVQCGQGFGIGCGTCPSCQKLLHDSHPDWHLIVPDGNNIRIDQIRELHSLMARRPHEGRRRIVVLDPADRMNDAAANALLKLLEEPPPDSLLLLITAHNEALLPTILSRCQPLRFGKLSKKLLLKVLEESASQGPELAPEKRHLILNLSNGSMSRLQEQLRTDSGEVYEERRQLIAWFLEEPQWDFQSRLRFIEERDGAGEDRESWLLLWRMWESLTRDRLVLALGGREEQIWNADALGSLQAMPQVSARILRTRIEQLADAARQIKSYTSPRLVAEGLLVKWLAN